MKLKKIPIKIFYSQLSGRFYASSSYKTNQDGTISITGEKQDVTDDIAELIIKNHVEFKLKEE